MIDLKSYYKPAPLPTSPYKNPLASSLGTFSPSNLASAISPKTQTSTYATTAGPVAPSAPPKTQTQANPNTPAPSVNPVQTAIAQAPVAQASYAGGTMMPAQGSAQYTEAQRLASAVGGSTPSPTPPGTTPAPTDPTDKLRSTLAALGIKLPETVAESGLSRNAIANDVNQMYGGLSNEITQANSAQEGVELTEFDKQALKRSDALKSSLARRGLVSTAGTQGSQADDQILEQSRDDDMARDLIRQRYAILNSNIRADLRQKAIDEIDRQFKGLEDSYYKRLTASNDAAKMGLDLYKTMTGEERANKQLELDTQKAADDKAYKDGLLSQGEYDLKIKQYNAETGRLSANADIAKTGAETGDKEKADLQAMTSTISIINDILPNVKNIFGLGQNPFNLGGLANAEDINKYKQLTANLALGARALIKGSGAISDYEARVLMNASSALGRNLNNEAAARELKKIRGVLLTNNGGTASVTITDTGTGQSKSGEISGPEIYSAIQQGYKVEYN